MKHKFEFHLVAADANEKEWNNGRRSHPLIGHYPSPATDDPLEFRYSVSSSTAADEWPPSALGFFFFFKKKKKKRPQSRPPDADTRTRVIWP